MSGWNADGAFARNDDMEADAHARTTPRAVERDAVLGSVLAGRYVIESYLGKGRYGEVYMALDRTMSDPALEQRHCVALHLLHPRVAEQPQLLQRLESVYHHPHLWSHPNVVKVRGFGADRGRYFLVTELLTGVTLRSILDESPDELLSEQEACALLRGVGDALKYAHAKGVIHGDIRPEKVFVTEDYAVKVLDLLPIIPTRTVPFFVEDATELAPPDRRDDVYGLASIAYELFAGRPPYNANSPLEAAHAGLTLNPITSISPARWSALVRGLALRRENRTPTVAELMGELGITGAETLRPVNRRGTEPPATSAPSPGAATPVHGWPSGAPPAPAATAPGHVGVASYATPRVHDYTTQRVRDDDVPVLVEPAAPPAPRVERHVPAAPLPPVPPPRNPPRRSRAWADDDPFVAPERWERTERRPPRRRGMRLALLVIAAAAALVVYTMFDRIEPLADEWLAAARTFVVNASRDPAERAAANDAPASRTDDGAAALPPESSSSAATPPETVASGAGAGARPDPGATGSSAAADTHANSAAPNAAGPAAAGAPSGAATSAMDQTRGQTPGQTPAGPAAEPVTDGATGTARSAGSSAAPDNAAVATAAAPVEEVEAPVVATVNTPPPEPTAQQPSTGSASGRSVESSATAAVPPPAATAPLQTAAAVPSGPEIIEPAARTVTVSESAAAAVIVVRRSGGDLGESSFAWWTSDGTARADDDFANLGARIEKFAPGETTRTIHVPLIRDSIVEPRETFYVNVRPSEQPGRRLDSQRVEVVVLDDD